MSRRTILDLCKYILAIGLLAWVVKANWAPPATKQSATMAASTVGLCATPNGPLLAAASCYPGRTEPKGLGYVWQRHVTEGQAIAVHFLLAGLALYVTAVGITLVRWYLLVRALDLPLTMRDALRYGFIGIFFNTFLPGAVGGDIIKAAVLARSQNGRRTAAVATVIMDRAIALWALIWFVAILGSIFWATGLLEGSAKASATYIVTGALITVGATLGVWLLLGLLPEHRAEGFAGWLTKLPGIGNTAAELWRSVWMYRCRQKCVAGVMALSWVGHVGFVLAFYCFARVLWSPELGTIPSVVQHFLLVPLGLVMQALVPTPGGAGGGEWGFAALYVLFQAAEANGVLASVVQRMLNWALGLVGYVVYLWMKPRTSEEEAPKSDPEMPALASGTPDPVAG